MILRTCNLLCIAALFTLLAGGCSNPKSPGQSELTAKSPGTQQTIVFMTDFGTANDAVAICRAVIAGIAPNARLADITHQVTPFQIEEASRYLAAVTPYYPSGTIFLVVVDPGVGTSRKALVVKSKRDQFFVLPDNGLVTPVIDRDGLRAAREITNRDWMIGAAVSSTFHGRDIFSPAAAHLAAGWDFTRAGPEVTELVRLPPKISIVSPKGLDGDIIGLDDPYGSLVTDIPAEDFQKLGYSLGDKVPLRLGAKSATIPYVKTFMDVPLGESLLYIDSRGRVGIAINQGNYSTTFGVAPPAKIFIPRKSARQ